MNNTIINPHLLSESELRSFSGRYMEAIYQDLSGYHSYVEGEKEKAAEDKIFLTYGEIMPESLNDILTILPLNEEDIFYDFGSGIGKVGLQVFMNTPVKQVSGIEASEKRYKSALKALEVVKKDLPELFLKNRKMDFDLGNFLEKPISDATVVFICATCFSEELMLDIGTLLKEKCPNLRFLTTLKPVSNCHLPLIGKKAIKCTWDDSACYFYGHGPLSEFEGFALES